MQCGKKYAIKIVLGGNFSVWPPISLLVAFSIYFPSLSFSLRERGGRGDEREFRQEREKVLLQKRVHFLGGQTNVRYKKGSEIYTIGDAAIYRCFQARLDRIEKILDLCNSLSL